MFKPLQLLVVISLVALDHTAVGQYGANKGPIYYTYPNPYCQRTLFPHYPVREDWVRALVPAFYYINEILGTWKVLFEYQNSGRYMTRCKRVTVKKAFSTLLSYNFETTIRTITTTEIYPDDHNDTHIIVSQHQGPAIEARYILDKTDGLFTKSAGRNTHAGSLVFLGFTSKPIDEKGRGMEPYDTALYAICSHSATLEDYGGSFVSEVGVLSKSGNASDESLEHYRKILDEDDVVDTALLRPVNQELCDVKK